MLNTKKYVFGGRKWVFSPDADLFDTKSTSNRYAFLDLLRFGACLMVMFWHYQHFFYCRPGVFVPDFSFNSQPFFHAFSFWYQNGACGVQIFWALSGFVFFAIFANSIGEKTLGVGRFVVDRFSRLYPLHFASLLVVASFVVLAKRILGHAGIYPHNNLYHFVLNLFFVPRIFPNHGWSFNAPVWSVSIELLAYAVFFLYARFLKASLVTALGITLIFGVLKPWPSAFPCATAINQCLFFFFAGGTLFLLEHECARHIRFGLAYLMLSIVCLCAALFLQKTTVWILFAVFLCSYPATLPPKLTKLCLFFGDLTYAMYMVHIPIQLGLMICVGLNKKISLPTLALSPYFFGAYWLILFVVSLVVNRCFEWPAKKAIRRLWKSQRSPSIN